MRHHDLVVPATRLRKRIPTRLRRTRAGTPGCRTERDRRRTDGTPAARLPRDGYLQGFRAWDGYRDRRMLSSLWFADSGEHSRRTKAYTDVRSGASPFPSPSRGLAWTLGNGTPFRITASRPPTILALRVPEGPRRPSVDARAAPPRRLRSHRGGRRRMRRARSRRPSRADR